MFGFRSLCVLVILCGGLALVSNAPVGAEAGAGAPFLGSSATNRDFAAFSDWPSPVNLGPALNTAAEESAPALSDDGRSLYFNRNPNLAEDNDEDLYVSHRSGPHAAWGDPVPLESINTSAFHERNATLSRDGLLLFFSSSRPGGFGGLDLYLSHG